MTNTKKLSLSAAFLAIGLVLPFFTGQLQQIGNMLLPMHLPVILCALVCGWKYGLAVGVMLPLLRSVLFGMPPLFPEAVAMSFELGTYALVSGYLYARSQWQCVRALYRALVAAMICGRVVWGLVMTFLMGLAGGAFTWKLFIAGALLNAIPGIILQLVLIPLIMVALDRARLVPFVRAVSPKHALEHGV